MNREELLERMPTPMPRGVLAKGNAMSRRVTVSYNDGDRTRSKCFTVRTDEYDALELLAGGAGMSKSEVVRTAVSNLARALGLRRVTDAERLAAELARETGTPQSKVRASVGLDEPAFEKDLERVCNYAGVNASTVVRWALKVQLG